jgi:hypothetical protein
MPAISRPVIATSLAAFSFHPVMHVPSLKSSPGSPWDDSEGRARHEGLDEARPRPRVGRGETC